MVAHPLGDVETAIRLDALTPAVTGADAPSSEFLAVHDRRATVGCDRSGYLFRCSTAITSPGTNIGGLQFGARSPIRQSMWWQQRSSIHF
jgi:hypothetical protein